MRVHVKFKMHISGPLIDHFRQCVGVGYFLFSPAVWCPLLCNTRPAVGSAVQLGQLSSAGRSAPSARPAQPPSPIEEPSPALAGGVGYRVSGRVPSGVPRRPLPTRVDR